ncbi:MAG: NAD(P)H-dependent oxidoreductase [Gemmatimonadota bacterium]|nr:NAD(P)H-dependent oxidoreductase [Gemmatimonadota bacterium]MDE2983122.1 NAD(P)H-dependent oxidoreductase [Gemmatimonadota bacterium]
MSATKHGEVGSALIVSASLDPESRSERIARRYSEALVMRGVASTFVTLKDYAIPGFDNPSELPSDCEILHRMVLDAEAVVLAGPIYNWGSSAELKRFIEFVGTTPPDGTRRGAFFDKIVTFIASAGLPHGYMGFAPTMASMILDFKCIINPYHVFVHSRNWDADRIDDDASGRIDRSADVLVALMRALRGRAYTSGWDI